MFLLREMLGVVSAYEDRRRDTLGCQQEQLVKASRTEKQGQHWNTIQKESAGLFIQTRKAAHTLKKQEINPRSSGNWLTLSNACHGDHVKGRWEWAKGRGSGAPFALRSHWKVGS